MIEERLVKNKKIALFGLLLAAVGCAMVLAARPAYATTFTVTSTGDIGDETPDGVCDSDPRIFLRCTLREAIQEANDTAGADTINFAIPGDGPHTIAPQSQLPTITEQVTIDGYTQGDLTPDTADDAKENTLAKGTNAVLKIEFSGQNAGDFKDGLIIHAPDVVVRGLVINNWHNRGIRISGNGGRIEGNFIGSDVSGSSDQGNRLAGVELSGAIGITVGGTTPDKRNLISANGVAGEGGPGVLIFGNSSRDIKVQGNLIGVEADGTTAMGNSGTGVVTGGVDVSVGGTQAAATNVIACNGGNGVAVTIFSDSSARILRNSIFSNAELGIDLLGGTEDASGATANDGGTADDADTGPNGLQNKPVLTSAVTSRGTTIEGVLDTKPDTTFTVQFFSNPSDNEGKKFIGQKQVPTASDGRVTFTFTPTNAVAVGQKITATATGPEGTSEFSAPKSVGVGP